MTAKNKFMKHGIICFAIFLCFTLIAIFSSKIHIGFFGCLSLLISGTIFTTIGVVIGDVFRRFALPDAYLTTGAVDTFKKKIFWMIGPQCIGWFIGFMATSGFMQNVMGYSGIL
jgi:hypothetical protein